MNTDLPSAWKLLRCPHCAAPLGPSQLLDGRPRTLACARGPHEFPIVAGIPLLSKEPDAWLKRWGEGMGRFVDQMSTSEKQLLVEIFEEDLGERGKQRVRQVIQGLALHRDEVVALMQRAGVEPLPSAATGQRAGTYSPETYFTLIHRDYGWAPEVDEVAISWGRLLRVLPSDFKLGSSLVLGAGTGRLAWQLAAQLGDGAPVLAVDINPLPFIITALLLAGEPVSLTELPAHPRRSTEATRTRALRCPLPPAPQLSLLFADGLDPPVPRGVFDTVVTPWFVDQVPADAAQIPALVSELLVDGGSFICTGPFLYDAGHTKPSLRYCADEFIEVVQRSGFEITTASYEVEPYVASPLSTQGRIEHVLYMHARKAGGATSTRLDPHPYLRPGPGGALPIPRPSGLEGRTFQPFQVNEVAALLDGTRSVLDITSALVTRGVLADDGAADAVVRACLQLILKQLGHAKSGS